ncbi:hypothetical protein R3P38DRAFT_3272054 [Favolaschia claudopus]|uniref:Uncharacterized protein n=1 Tax=Favolaschia claudopus TaxID=2862362 RepID=A0AAW0B5W7_9AGAR
MHTLSTLEVDVIKRDRVVDKRARDVNINRVTSFVVKAAKRQLDSVPPRALSLPSLISTYRQRQRRTAAFNCLCAFPTRPRIGTALQREESVRFIEGITPVAVIACPISRLDVELLLVLCTHRLGMLQRLRFTASTML